MLWGKEVSFGSSSPVLSCDAASCIGFAIAPVEENVILLDINRMTTGSNIKILLFFIDSISFHLVMFWESRFGILDICIYIWYIFTIN